MKRAILLLICICALLLSMPAQAAECGEVILSDGNRCRECALGDFAADALREYTGADIALFASGDLGIGLQPGEITTESLAASFPEDKPVVLTSVTAQELRALLETALAHITLGCDEAIDETASAWDGFFCVSGFTFSYDASAPAGERIYDLNIDGDRFLLAVSADYAEGDPVCTVREAAAAYCAAHSPVTSPEMTRIRVLGANENAIVGGYIPRGFILVIAAVAILFGGARYRRRMNTER